MTDESVVKPTVLYKYCAFNEHTERIFTRNEIYFHLPGEFKDPFDSKLRLISNGTKQEKNRYLCEQYQKKYPERSKREILAAVDKIVTEGNDKTILKETLEKSGELFRKKFGICCFTEKRDNILMWAHYAKDHTGFCLEFDTSNEFIAPRILKIDYEVIWPELNVLQLDSYPEGELANKLLVKARDWLYEQEWRIVDKKGKGIQNFPEDALSGVILGCRILQESKENMFRWCRKRKYPPMLYGAREKQKEFGLDIVRIDY